MLAGGGVDVSGVIRDPGVGTAMTVIFVRPDGDRAMLTFPGALAAFGPEHVDALGAGPRPARPRRVGLPAAAARCARSPVCSRAARDAGVVTSVDTNDDPSGEWVFERDALLPVVDYLLPNEREAVALAFGPSSDNDARRGRGRSPPTGRVVVVKCGAAGAFAVRASDHGCSVQRAALDPAARRRRASSSTPSARATRSTRAWWPGSRRGSTCAARCGWPSRPARCRCARSAAPTASRISARPRRASGLVVVEDEE